MSRCRSEKRSWKKAEGKTLPPAIAIFQESAIVSGDLTEELECGTIIQPGNITVEMFGEQFGQQN